ncbi:MAG TPA: YdbL family protein [Sphingomicrobium sp.]|nr:YdbL family protein [Sphingomicrobium sp.]
MIKGYLTLTLMLLGLAAVRPALAQDSQAIVAGRAGGLVGERFDGYLGFVRTPPEALRKQVGAINIRRRALYYDLAVRKRVTPEEVGITAACMLLGRVAVGEYYLHGQGSWQRRLTGQPAPVPSYCG